MRRLNRRNIAWAMAVLMAFSMVPQGSARAAEQMEKSETVYVSQLADGTVDMIRVSDTIKNVPASGKVSDVSHLTDIKNTKGNEAFEAGKDGDITWEAKGKNISYEGNTLEKLPVGVEYEFVLDGKVMKPEEMLGKSGKLELTISYQNTQTFQTELKGKKETMKTPFMMVSVLILPTDIFSKVEVSQGKISDQDLNQIVTAYGMPGVIDDLKLDKDAREELEDDLSDTVTITAQVKDFELSSIYTVATTELFKDIKLGDNENIEELGEALDGLVEASDKLIEGNEKMTEGITTFSGKFGEYADGIKSLDKGASSLATGTNQLSKGINSYTSSVNQFATGIGQYVTGTKDFATGVTAYVEGEKEIQAGLADLQSQTKSLPSQYGEFHDQLKAYVDAVNGIDASTDSVVNAYENAPFETVGVDNGAYLGDLQDKLEGMENLSEEEKQAIINAAAQAVANAAGDSADQQRKADKQVVNAVGEQVSSMGGELQSALDGLKAAGNQLVVASETQMKPAIAGTVDGISGVLGGMKSLGNSNASLLAAAKSLADSGAGLKTGASKLTDASKQMKSATKQLKSGAQKLAKGTGAISKATDAVGTGINQLAEGSNALLDGTKTFKEEGTLELKNQFDDKIIGLVDRVDALAVGAKEYQSFSGMHKDMKGDVTFIFTTEKIIKDKDK